MKSSARFIIKFCLSVYFLFLKQRTTIFQVYKKDHFIQTFEIRYCNFIFIIHKVCWANKSVYITRCAIKSTTICIRSHSIRTHQFVLKHPKTYVTKAPSFLSTRKSIAYYLENKKYMYKLNLIVDLIELLTLHRIL